MIKFYQNLNKRKNKGSLKEGQSDDNNNKTSVMAKCGGFRFTPQEHDKICVDYQELRIQEEFKHISAGKLPQTLTVIL